MTVHYDTDVRRIANPQIARPDKKWGNLPFALIRLDEPLEFLAPVGGFSGFIMAIHF